MAALNTVTNLKSLVELDGKWNSITASADQTKGLFILIKQTVAATENIKNDDIQAITMAIGVDSGEADQILWIDSYTFNFSPIAYVSDNTINDRAAYCKINQQLPKKFYYQFTAIETKDKVYTPKDLIEKATVKANIKFNLEELDF